MLPSDAIDRAQRFAPFLRASIGRHPDIVELVREGTVREALNSARTIDTAEGMATRLRKIRDRLALAVALGDLAGALSLEQVVETLSDFADEAVDAAIADVLGDTAGFAAIALGKHGSRELNYSSDIDLILLYDPDRIARRPRDEPAEAAQRAARRLVEMLQNRDGDGYVFRVDLRLRPASEATPLALPVAAAISHYESSALGWERAAFIRARAAAGDRTLGQGFLDAVAPFVWRRSLDFGAVAELQALTHRIRDHHGRRGFGPGYDLKRGRGGIREVEFFAQIHQLIHGGRDTSLRSGATMPALEALASAGWITRAAADELAPAYRLLRTIEHRVQMVDDLQTHRLPDSSAALDNVAALHGLADGSALLDLLRPHVEAVGTLYDALDDGHAETAPVSDDALVALFAGAGFAEPESAAHRVVEWRTGRVRAIRSGAALAALDHVLPGLVAAFGAAPDPDDALARFDRVLGRLSSAINLFRLLDARPAIQALLVEIVSHAPTLSDALAERPALFDRLLDQTAFDLPPGEAALLDEMRAASRLDTEAALDRVRHIVGEHRFALGCQIVEGTADPLDVAAGYGRIATAAVKAVGERVIADFQAVHGEVPQSELLALALGRLGGGLLTHASDLDLVFIFTGDFQADSNGRKPLGASHYYNRLAQRVTAGLSVPTSVGPLYEIDTRLRPSGSQGPLVVSLDSFARYQRENAWTWEHMALTRARPVLGSSQACDAVQAIIDEVLRQPRSPAKLAGEVVAMRGEIATHKPPRGPLDVKLEAGGLIDLEFGVHYHQLRTGIGLFPDLRRAIEALAEEGVVDSRLLDAHDLLTRMLVTLRLVAPDLEEPGQAGRNLLARACGHNDWQTLVAELDMARQTVRAHWAKVIEAGGRE